LKLAVAAFRAGCALLVVACEHKLDYHFPHFADLCSVGLNHHAVGSFGRASRKNPASISVLNLDYTHTAGSENAYVGVVAECRKFDSDFAAKLNQVDFTLKRYLNTVYNNFTHFLLPPIPL
jgi:hypothetical protein